MYITYIRGRQMVGLPSALLFLIILCLSPAGCRSPSVQTHPVDIVVDEQQRIDRIKQSIVRIHVDGEPRGTGFVITENGLIATAFHVIGKTVHPSNDQAYITYASSIEVEFDDGYKLPARVHKSCIGQGLHGAVLRDFCILEIKTLRHLTPLRMGRFTDVDEGSRVYMCGYPLVDDRLRLSFGTVSYKPENNIVSYQGQSFNARRRNTEVALLDIPMSRGDSGGPIILIGESPEEDKVIGIVTFITTPLDQKLKALVQAFNRSSERRHSDVCPIERFLVLREEIESDSLFITGCVSVDPLRLRLNRILNGKSMKR